MKKCVGCFLVYLFLGVFLIKKCKVFVRRGLKLHCYLWKMCLSMWEGMSELRHWVAAKHTYFEGLQSTEKELYCRAFHETFSDIFKHLYNLEFEFSSAAACRRWVSISSGWKPFESFRVGELLLVTYQCKWQNFWKICRSQTFLLLLKLFY